MFHVNPLLIRLDISFEFSAKQRIHMKHHALFSWKDKSKKKKIIKIKVLSVAILLGSLRVKSRTHFGKPSLCRVT